MTSISLPAMFAAVLVITTGTVIQASVGFGLALIAAPLLYLIDPVLVPGPLIFTAWTLSLWVAFKERHALIFSHIKPALLGRLLGSPLAALLLGSVSALTFDLVFGSLVLVAVAISLLHSNLQPNSRNIFIAATASGFMGTLSGIGGPPIALVYQNVRGVSLRANLAMFFLLGTSISLALLAIIGRFGLAELGYGLLLQIGVVLGYFISKPLQLKLDKHNVRPLLLGLCALTALMVIADAVKELLH